jgi:hypothetical protein
MARIRFINSRSAPLPDILSVPLNVPRPAMIPAIVVLALLAALVVLDGGADNNPPRAK